MNQKTDDSRERILRAAEQIFADKGLAGASVRAITRAAGVNHALIGYYFGSKIALYQEVLERSTALLSTPKLVRLAELRKKFGAAPIPLRELIDAYIRSFFDDYGNPESVAKTWLRFYGRMFSEGDDEVCSTTIQTGVHVRSAFLEELQKTLPDHSRKQLVYRLGAMIGAYTFWRGETGLLDFHLEDKAMSQIEVGELIEELITMCCALFSAMPSTRKAMTGQAEAKRPKVVKSITALEDPENPSGQTGKKSRRHRRQSGTAG
ncbi:MAG TPA: TetR/AcrR family transcriptional regulator [Xanthomonadales bacterium]|nr:TetR/AcrR family transcriptional regulator [Xanthomonadales bacterium]